MFLKNLGSTSYFAVTTHYIHYKDLTTHKKVKTRKECFLTCQCLLSTTRSGCVMITLPPSTRGQDNPGFIQLTRPAISTHFNVANLILNTKRNLSQTWHAHEPKWELTVPFCQKSSQAAGQSHWHWKSLRRINIESTLGLINGMKSMPGCQSRKARLLFSTWLSCNDSHPAVAHRHSINRLNSLIYNLQKGCQKKNKSICQQPHPMISGRSIHYRRIGDGLWILIVFPGQGQQWQIFTSV